MTREYIQKTYGIAQGYICCCDCPCNDTCESITCNGRDDAYKAIARHFNEPLEDEVTNTSTVPDMVNHPPHYTNGGMECIDEMILIFGKEAVANFCICNAWKYRYRAISKNGEEDMQKSHWYINKYKELMEDSINE